MQQKNLKNIKKGPKEDRLNIDFNWKKAVKKAIEKKKPKEGWPEQPKKKEK